MASRLVVRMGVYAAVLPTIVLVATRFDLPVRAESPRVHMVQQLLQDDKPVLTAFATVTRAGNVEHILRRNETILDGTRIDVPSHLVVIIVSSGAKSTVTLEPGASITFASTGRGELLYHNGGNALFGVVPESLDFFRVNSGEALAASVHGTEFSITGSEESVTFTCDSGEVNITRTGHMLIGAERITVQLVDSISAAKNPTVTYRPSPTWYLAKFANFAEAQTYYQQRLSAARQTGDDAAVANALLNLGLIQWRRGEYTDALQAYREAHALFQTLGNRDGEAAVINNVGLVQRAQGNDAAALQSFQQAFALSQMLGDRDLEGSNLNNIGGMQEKQGQHAAALQSRQQALALFQTLGDRDREANALWGIGVIQDDESQYAEALDSFRQALALYRTLGDLDGAAGALMGIGIVERHQGGYSPQSFQMALAVFQQLGDLAGEAWAFMNLGGVQEDAHRYSDALQSYERALALYQTLGNRSRAAVAKRAIERVMALLLRR